MVYPSGHIPFIAYKNKATIIEINTEKSYLTPLVTKYFLRGKAGKILPKIVEKIEKQFSN
jgi:NAD-dependent SIR2 family protein deacetylase